MSNFNMGKLAKEWLSFTGISREEVLMESDTYLSETSKSVANSLQNPDTISISPGSVD